MHSKICLCSNLTALYSKNCLTSEPKQKIWFNWLITFSNSVLPLHNTLSAKKAIISIAWSFLCHIKIPLPNCAGIVPNFITSYLSFRYGHLVAFLSHTHILSISIFCQWRPWTLIGPCWSEKWSFSSSLSVVSKLVEHWLSLVCCA